jgi:hypothetical protein
VAGAQETQISRMNVPSAYKTSPMSPEFWCSCKEKYFDFVYPRIFFLSHGPLVLGWVSLGLHRASMSAAVAWSYIPGVERSLPYSKSVK